MSYRTFKRLLGENSLERKCRFLFGGALLLLITGSFYVYAWLNLDVVRSLFRQRAQLLISQNLENEHWLKTIESTDPEAVDLVKDLNKEFKPAELREERWKFIDRDDPASADPTSRPTHRAIEPFEIDALQQLLYQQAPFVVHEDPSEGKYHLFEPILASKSCLHCHADQQIHPSVKQVGDIMGVARLTFHLHETQRAIARNNAFLFAMAIVTAFLAMLASYLIVRYVIVKPVIHLKDVSDSVAHGDLDQRADIRTGDEFEELSHAFNRMLRHLVTAQEELRAVANDLDGKVDELAQANLSLHEMNKLKNEFLATMSHELRTPLNSILGFSDVLTAAENLTDKQRKYVSNIQSSGKNLLMLVNDILDLAKIEAGRMEINISEIVVSDLLEMLVGSLRPLAEKKNIDLDWEVGPELITIEQDVGKLQQIVNNLLSNAVKFTPEGGRIHVSAQALDEEYFEIVVADTGVGIPLEDQSIIFEKFRQGRNKNDESALTREYEGTGLGLSIVRELTGLLQGEVALESEFGKGSSFQVRLPRRLAASCPLPALSLANARLSDGQFHARSADLLRK